MASGVPESGKLVCPNTKFTGINRLPKPELRDTEGATGRTNCYSIADDIKSFLQDFLVTPLGRRLTPFFKRKVVDAGNCALFPNRSEFEQRGIERIKAAVPGLALVVDVPVDTHSAPSQHHPLIKRYIRDNFDPPTPDNWTSSLFQFYWMR